MIPETMKYFCISETVALLPSKYQYRKEKVSLQLREKWKIVSIQKTQYRKVPFSRF